MRVRLLGGFGVSVGLRIVGEGEWRLRKAASLVKLLALAPEHRLHRERVTELLWPELELRAAANNLHYAIHHARRSLEPAARGARASHCLAFRDELLALCPEVPLRVDAKAFEEAADIARRTRDLAAYRAAIDLYTGELLPQDRYEPWTEDRREGLRWLYLRLLVELAGLYKEREDFELAIEALIEAVAKETAYEEAHVDLMRLYALSGRRHEAMLQYERLRNALSEEPGFEPGEASGRLYEEIRTGRYLTTSLPWDKEGERPPREPVDESRQNLPATGTSFIGRRRELVELKRELATSWLVTLTGAGGCGKTRLASEVVRDLAGAYPDGVWKAELVGLTEPALVPQAVASALKVREQPNRPLMDTLVDTLRSKRVLLVLDNCEHLLEGASRLAETLLKSCPNLRILATSREPLGIVGEVRWQVPSLSFPDSKRAPAVEEAREISSYESVRLFLDRARQREPAFDLTGQNLWAVAEICEKLEGIPLALELAAARVGVLSVEQIAERLEDSIKLLVARDQAADPRHQTLGGTLDWSYELLGESEKVLFERLSVFAGGWSLEAAEAVAAGDEIDQGNILDLLSSLVDKSLVVAEMGAKGAPRYRMLEPVGQYARERLEHSGEAERSLKRHAEYYLVLAERAERELSGPDQGEWLDRLETEHDNLRTALSYLLGGDETELGLGLATTLWLFWYTHGYLNEGREWLEKSAFVGGARALHPKAKALNSAGYLALFQGNYEAAKGLIEEALDLFRELEDQEGLVSTLSLRGVVALLGQQDLETVAALHEEAMSLRPEIEDPRTLAYLLLFSGLIAVGRSDWEQAEALHEQSLALFREIRDVLGTGTCLTNLSLMALDRKNHVRAAALFQENLRVVPESDKSGILHNLVGLACAASAQDQPVHAARLWGAVEAIQEAFAIRLTPMTRERIYHDEHLSNARAQLDDALWQVAWAEGKSMTTEQAIEYAFSGKEQPLSTSPAPVEASTVLTRREEEVALLVGRGLTNRRVAEELAISEHTAITHVRNILKKLGVHSRIEITAWLAEQGRL